MHAAFAIRGCFFAAALGLAATAARADMFSLVSGTEQLTAVSSKVFGGYVRAKNPDGTFRTETFAFGNGGEMSAAHYGADIAMVQFNGAPTGGGVVADPTIDEMSFGSIANTIARPLEEQHYVPTRNPNATNLLIMVYWGRSAGSYQSHDGSLKDYMDARNAQLMGFDSERVFRDRVDYGTEAWGRSFRSMMLDNIHSSLITAIEMDRYYVVLRAFDFQTAWKDRKIKLLWETRFSLSERQHDFTKELPTMAHTASKYFGQDTHGIVRERIPEGSVEIGTVKSLGNVPGN